MQIILYAHGWNAVHSGKQTVPPKGQGQQRDEFCYYILMMSLKPFTLEIGDLLSSVQSKIKFMHNLSHV